MTGEWLLERMEEWRDLTAIVWADTGCSYGELLERVERWHSELTRLGVSAGSVVVLDGEVSPNACGLLLALMSIDAIAVPLTRGVRAHRQSFAEIAEAQLIVEFDDDDGWTTTRTEHHVTNPLTGALIDRGRAGLVLFSSGSTGAHKAILHDFGQLIEKFRVSRQRKCTLTFLLFDHVGGIDTLFNTLSNGGSLITLRSRDPESVCSAIADHAVHTLPASPTFLALLLMSQAHRRHDMSSLMVIAYGTEPMPESTLARLAEELPTVTLVQTYGMSELGVLRSRSKESGSLWMQFTGDGFEVKVVDGMLWVRTPTAMLGYLNAPDLIAADGWMNTEDAVEVDGEYLRILGRSTDLINVGGQKVYPAEVESVLARLANVKTVAVYGEANAVMGQIVAARVTLIDPEDIHDFKRRMRAFAREHLAQYKVPVRVELTDDDQFNARFKKMRRPSIVHGSGKEAADGQR